MCFQFINYYFLYLNPQRTHFSHRRLLFFITHTWNLWLGVDISLGPNPPNWTNPRVRPTDQISDVLMLDFSGSIWIEFGYKNRLTTISVINWANSILRPKSKILQFLIFFKGWPLLGLFRILIHFKDWNITSLFKNYHIELFLFKKQDYFLSIINFDLFYDLYFKYKIK